MSSSGELADDLLLAEELRSVELTFEEAEALCDPLKGVFLMSQSVRLLAYEVADALEDPESELAAK